MKLFQVVIAVMVVCTVQVAAEANVKMSNLRPLHHEVPAVKVLLAFNANIELGDTNGKTPLMLAVRLGSVDLAKLLVQASPNSVHAIDKSGDSVLGIAALNGQLELFVSFLAVERS
ncbi:unnamed protein product [Phytophthora lilii]|uniref:Unnamed protein product n=1 Tax=Phytophthora lilii TaxID=2077276 RepID=A0A9W6XBQ7_9STRA|nr:unnamed protein product [Phytophthora lilii]